MPGDFNLAPGLGNHIRNPHAPWGQHGESGSAVVVTEVWSLEFGKTIQSSIILHVEYSDEEHVNGVSNMDHPDEIDMRDHQTIRGLPLQLS